VLVTDKGVLAELAHVWQGAGHVASSAATIVLVVPEVDDEQRARTIAFDLGQATALMTLAATDLGIGSGHASIQDQDLLRRLLDIPNDRRGAYLLALGYPADRPLRPIERPDRRPLSEVVDRER
jgi:nitroreductase